MNAYINEIHVEDYFNYGNNICGT